MDTYSGPCLVVGNAECLPGDLKRARAIFPDAPCIAVNGGARYVKAFALYSQHPEHFKAKGWLHQQTRRYGSAFSVHAATGGPCGPSDCPWVDRWWEGIRGGSSAWGARKVAGLIGFDPVILVGCPLDAGHYVHGIGQLMTRDKVIRDLRDFMAADTGWHSGAYSVSGWTSDLLGWPYE